MRMQIEWLWNLYMFRFNSCRIGTNDCAGTGFKRRSRWNVLHNLVTWHRIAYSGVPAQFNIYHTSSRQHLFKYRIPDWCELRSHTLGPADVLRHEIHRMFEPAQFESHNVMLGSDICDVVRDNGSPKTPYSI